MDPFIGQIMLVGFNFAPRGWATCDGQLLPIASYTALFSLLGTTYGGDGKTTFALPDLRGRVPVHHGTGPGLPAINMGKKIGTPVTKLTEANLPPHAHTLNVKGAVGDQIKADGHLLAQVQRTNLYSDAGAPDAKLNGASIGQTGSGSEFDNHQPSLGMNWVIALQGIFPSRS